MLNRNDKSRCPHLESFQSFTIKNRVSRGIFVDALYRVEQILSYFQIVECVIMRRHWILSNAFFASVDVIPLLFFILLRYIGLIECHMLNQTCIPGINLTWSRCLIIFTCCWNSVCQILLGIFASVFMRDIGLQFYTVGVWL